MNTLIPWHRKRRRRETLIHRNCGVNLRARLRYNFRQCPGDATPMTSFDAFSPDYHTARHRFREAAARLGWQQEVHPIDPVGPGGSELTMDVASSLGREAQSTVIVSSGVHGVEGFFGSAVQLGLLDCWHRDGPPSPGVRCVFLHGLNPFGFAWLRRFDENNVDLNRNFLL